MKDVVKIKSNNPAHPQGYYIQFANRVKPDDVIYTGEAEEVKAEPKAPVLPKKRGKK